MTALHRSAFLGKTEMAAVLISRGANVNARTTKPLITVTVPSGSAPGRPIPVGVTPLRLAIIFDNSDVAGLLRQRGGRR
jgi:ankyrin repeat protein